MSDIVTIAIIQGGITVFSGFRARTLPCRQSLESYLDDNIDVVIGKVENLLIL
jgi:hypothetical protein